MKIMRAARTAGIVTAVFGILIVVGSFLGDDGNGIRKREAVADPITSDPPVAEPPADNSVENAIPASSWRTSVFEMNSAMLQVEQQSAKALVRFEGWSFLTAT